MGESCGGAGPDGGGPWSVVPPASCSPSPRCRRRVHPSSRPRPRAQTPPHGSRHIGPGGLREVFLLRAGCHGPTGPRRRLRHLVAGGPIEAEGTRGRELWWSPRSSAIPGSTAHQSTRRCCATPPGSHRADDVVPRRSTPTTAAPMAAASAALDLTTPATRPALHPGRRVTSWSVWSGGHRLRRRRLCTGSPSRSGGGAMTLAPDSRGQGEGVRRRARWTRPRPSRRGRGARGPNVVGAGGDRDSSGPPDPRSAPASRHGTGQTGGVSSRCWRHLMNRRSACPHRTGDRFSLPPPGGAPAEHAQRQTRRPASARPASGTLGSVGSRSRPRTGPVVGELGVV